MISTAEGAIRLMGQSPWITLIHKASELICFLWRHEVLRMTWSLAPLLEGGSHEQSKRICCLCIHSLLFLPLYPGQWTQGLSRETSVWGGNTPWITGNYANTMNTLIHTKARFKVISAPAGMFLEGWKETWEKSKRRPKKKLPCLSSPVFCVNMMKSYTKTDFNYVIYFSIRTEST